jgi:transcriptional regulator with XRE-family HTH domain
MRRRIHIRLRECLELYEHRTGNRLSYRELARRAGVSEDTIESIASRSSYNPTLRTLERLCDALNVSPNELLSWHI